MAREKPGHKTNLKGLKHVIYIKTIRLYLTQDGTYDVPFTIENHKPVDSTQIQLTEQTWTSLKIAIIILAALGPVIIAFLTIRYKKIIKGLKQEHQTNQGIIEKRIEVYDRMGPVLNDLICFYCYSGNWKEITPMDILRKKMELDKDINTYSPIFSNELSKKYSDFIQLCFVSFSGWDHKEKIKSLYELRQEHNEEWNDEWIPIFDTNNVIEATKMRERYDELIEYFKKEMNL